MPRSSFEEAFERLAAQERDFYSRQFLAPVDGDAVVCVRIAGVVCRFKVRPRRFRGWGVFRPTGPKEAELLREATLKERAEYLKLFPLLRVVLCRKEGAGWLAVPANRAAGPVRTDGFLPVRLVDEAGQFDTVRTRFDGASFWFESLERSVDPAIASYLRRALNQTIDPAELACPGLTPEQRTAYASCYVELEAVRQRLAEVSERERLRRALAHAGAELLEYTDAGDHYRVTWQSGRRQYVSAIAKSDLTVQAAGICLSGRDQMFDLASLVSVVREGERTGELFEMEIDEE